MKKGLLLAFRNSGKSTIVGLFCAWVLVPFLAIKFGVNGAAAGYALVGLSSVIPIYIAFRYVAFSITDAILKPVGASVVMFAIMLILRNTLPINLYSVFIIGGLGTLAYLFCSYLIYGSSIFQDAKKGIWSIFSK